MHQNARCASAPQKVDDNVENLRVQNRWRLEEFAGSRCAGEDENSRADDGANAESGERPRAQRFFEPVFRMFGFGYELVDGFAGKQLVAPGCLIIDLDGGGC